MAYPVVEVFVFLLLMVTCGITREVPIAHRVRKCFSKDYSLVCLKEEALDFLNQTVMSQETIRLGDFMDIEKDPEFTNKYIDNDLPTDMAKRDEKLNELLIKKAEEYFESRSIRFHLANVNEGRKKKGGGGGKMAMMAMAACMMAQGMMSGKTAMVAVIALVLAKMAMMMTGMSMMKKMVSGGETQHIVYTADLGGGGGGGGGYGSGGGWARSLLIPSNNHEIIYRAYTPPSLQENQLNHIH